MVENNFAGPIAVETGEAVNNAVAAEHYLPPSKPATPTELAAVIVAARFRLSPCVARLVCHLAQIGGRLA